MASGPTSTGRGAHPDLQRHAPHVVRHDGGDDGTCRSALAGPTPAHIRHGRSTSTVHGRIRGRLERLQSLRRLTPVRSDGIRTIRPHRGFRTNSLRLSVSSDRGLSTQSAEGAMPNPVRQSCGLLSDPLAIRAFRGTPHGLGPWAPLPRVLRGTDALGPRCRCRSSRMDGLTYATHGE